MFRFFYRYARRYLRRQLTDEYVVGDMAKDITKWWFDCVRNLMLASLVAYLAYRSGSWLAYVIAYISFLAFTTFLFHPVFGFMARAAHTSKHKVLRRRVSYMSSVLFINIFSIALIATYFTLFLMARLHDR